GDFGAALAEFRRAYELMPSYKILYNLGQVSYQRHDYAAALRAFRQYLADGDDAIPDERRREVAGAIVDLESRVGRVEIASGDEANGAIALRSKHDLDGQLNMFPQDASEVDYDRRKTRGFAMATDGLLIGTAVMTAISSYFTFRDPR